MWTLATYNALTDYQDAAKRDRARATLIAAGLTARVAELDAAKTMQNWYEMHREAFNSLSPTDAKRDRIGVVLSSKK